MPVLRRALVSLAVVLSASVAIPSAVAQPLEPNSPSLVLNTVHTGGSGVTDRRIGRTNTAGPDYTYDVQTFYFDSNVVGGRGDADRTEAYVEQNMQPIPSQSRYIEKSNLARRVVVAKGSAWNNPAVEQIDLILLMPGTGQDDLRSMDWFFAQRGQSPATDAFPVGLNSALTDASRALNIPATDVVVAAMNAGRSITNDGIIQWNNFNTELVHGVEHIATPAFGDQLADVRRVLAFKNAFVAANPRIRHVYLAGFSAGAVFTENFICFLPDEFDGYGVFDEHLTASMFTHCGNRTFGDGNVITREIRQQVGRYPSRLSATPRPIFYMINTHSPKASEDMGEATAGPAPQTVACGAIGRRPGRLLDNPACQEDWYGTGTGSEIELRSTRPRQTARNSGVIVPGQFDYQATVERYLSMLGVNGTYKSVREPFPCVGSNAAACQTFVQQPQFCTNNGVTGGGLSYFREDTSGAHDAMRSTGWVWNQGGQQVVGYVEVYGGGHMVPGRGLACTIAGRTADVDGGTEFLIFMSTWGGLILR